MSSLAEIRTHLAAQCADWEDPDWSLLNDGRPPAPAFPLDMLGPWSAWARDYAASKSAPVDYAAAGLLFGAAAALGDVRHVLAWAGFRQPPALWVAMVGPPSAAKSPIFSPVADALHSLEADENAGFDDKRRAYEADKLAAAEYHERWGGEVRKAVQAGRPRPDMPIEADEPPAPTPARIVTGDATQEALAQLHKANPRGLSLVRDELSGWIGDFNKYGGGGEAAFFLSRYDGGALTVDRKRDGHIAVPRALLSIFGGIQPEPFRELLLSKRADDGFVSRFLFFSPNPAPRVRPAVAANMEIFKVALRRLRSLPFEVDDEARPVARVVKLSAKAADQFEPWWRANGDAGAEASGFLAGTLGKAPGVVLRLALLLEYLDWAGVPDRPEPEVVSEAAVLRAIGLFEDYFAPMAARVFGGADMTREEAAARALLRYLRRERRSVVNLQDLRGKVTGLRRTGEVDAALSELAGAGWTRPAPGREGDRPGRPRRDWAVNPTLWEKE
jgi:hypothetical protein